MEARPLKFAVVREDSLLEQHIISSLHCSKPLLVASGGCTLLDLKTAFPSMELSGFDFNPTQINHIKLKQDAVKQGNLSILNINDASSQGLNQCGEFESLFRIWKTAFMELVSSPQDTLNFFLTPDHSHRLAMLESWKQNPYWNLTFDLLMHHPMLDTMFGPEATQHAEQGSYPAYFKAVFERGLAQKDAHNNPFLQHILLGYYLPHSAPAYTRAHTFLDLNLMLGSLTDIPNLSRYDFVQLSNIFDWSDDALISSWADALQNLKQGAVILIRQLNNTRDLKPFFAPHFSFDHALAKTLLQRDRSLFYNHIEVGIRA